MGFVSDRRRDPFGLSLPCDRAVQGFGDVSADFHVIGDHPGVHGGLDSGIPFTGRPWSGAFFAALSEAGLVREFDLEAEILELDRTFLSYLHACDPGDSDPTDAEYANLEPFFDAELRAVTAHVLVPVGGRATGHVLRTYTARDDGTDVEALHGRELRGSGFLVLPMKDPGEWDGDDAETIVDGLDTLRSRDFRQEADLGRYLPGADPYLVR